jgi:extradiol dioxygenase family protein
MHISEGCQIRDVAESRRFFSEELGFTETRIDDGCWQFSLGSNSIVCRLAPSLGKEGKVAHNYRFMPGKASLVPHCTVTLALQDWNALITRLRRCGLKPVKERNTFFVIDPSGNAVEFKVSNNRDVSASGSRRTTTAIKWGAGIFALLLLSAWLVLRGAN